MPALLRRSVETAALRESSAAPRESSKTSAVSAFAPAASRCGEPVAAFTPQRLQMHLRTPTLRETGMDFQYFMQRSVVGAPGMSAPAQAYYMRLFKQVFDTPEWQDYMKKNSLRGDFLAGPQLMKYWLKERQKHERWDMALRAMKR